MNAFLNWINGWRFDHEGWLVRARRITDPDLKGLPELGFTEEACIAVRSHTIARQIDRAVIIKEESC